MICDSRRWFECVKSIADDRQSACPPDCPFLKFAISSTSPLAREFATIIPEERTQNNESVIANALAHADLSIGRWTSAKTSSCFMLALVEMDAARALGERRIRSILYVQIRVESRALLSSLSSPFHLRFLPP